MTAINDNLLLLVAALLEKMGGEVTISEHQLVDLGRCEVQAHRDPVTYSVKLRLKKEPQIIDMELLEDDAGARPVLRMLGG